MQEYKADLHIHTVLSPCGDLEMSPVNIVNAASQKGLDIIGVADHNTTRHCRLITQLAAEKGIFVMPGAEVNTQEEIHCLAFFENIEILDDFQAYLDQYLPRVKNDPNFFGYQVQVNEKDEIVYEEEISLFGAIEQSIGDVENKVHELNGIFIPAHVDRQRDSVYSQLGLFPDDLNPDAIEISWRNEPGEFLKTHPELLQFTVLRNSDAHFPDDIGRVFSRFLLMNRNFKEIKMALARESGRRVCI